MAEELECKCSGFDYEGGEMKVYDNLINFLDSKAKSIYRAEKKFPIQVDEGNQMHGREGYYVDIYHLNGSTISVKRWFEMNCGKINLSCYGDNSSKIAEELNKLMDIKI